LIRESYRKNRSLKNNTVANISKLPDDLINNIKSFLEGKKGDFNISDLKLGRNYEFGIGKGGKRGYKQVAIGVLTNAEGCPVGVEIFKGNTSDQTTVLGQIKKISEKYGIKEAIFVGDRGM